MSEAVVEGLKNVAKIAEAASSFIPVLDAISKLIKEIVGIYEKSEFNKNMCSRLVDRVLMAEYEIKRLKLIKKRYEGKFKEQEYYDSLQKFITTLEKIKRFIKEKFESLAQEFDNSMKHLNFSMAIDFEEQRKLDTDELKSSLNEIKKINIMKSRDTFVFKPFQIEQKDLTPCSLSPDEFSRLGNSSYLCKRMYKFEE
ncbi:16404_t:CDS:2, partial [Racocetra fulgida]